MMHLIPLHVNRAKRSGRAEVFAGTAADAFVLVHGRHFDGAVRAFVVDHHDGSCWAMAFTVAATDAIGQYDTVVFNPHGVTDMLHSLLFPCDGLDGTGRADLATTGAFRAAIAAFKRHHGLHKVHQVGGGTQDVVRAR